MDAATLARMRDGARTLGVVLDDPTVTRLNAYLDELGRWGRGMNLTASLEPQRLVEHVLDCLPLLAELPVEARCVDVGSGGGFPGLVIACCRPEQRLTLVESVAKKGAFLRQAARAAGLSAVTVDTRRAEALAPAEFDAAVSRAAMAPDDWLALGRRLVRAPGGRVIAMLQGDAPTPAGCRRVDYKLPGGAQHALAVLDLA